MELSDLHEEVIDPDHDITIDGDSEERQENGEVIEIHEFLESVKSGLFSDDDGFCHLIMGDTEIDKAVGVNLSNLKHVTHVRWFNK